MSRDELNIVGMWYDNHMARTLWNTEEYSVPGGEYCA